MNFEMVITTQAKLDKPSVFEIGRIVNRAFQDTVIGGKGKKVATTKQDNDGFHYTFEFTTIDEYDESICDALASELYSHLDIDFSVCIECDVEEEYLEPCPGDSQILIDGGDSADHAEWMHKMHKEGWTFAMEHCDKNKTSPFLRPYHSLSETQHKFLIKSKKSLGYYGVDSSLLDQHYDGDGE